MKPAPFDYVAPRSLDEAVAALAEGGTDAKLLAGGQSLIPLLNFRLARPALLVDLNRVAELAYVRPRNRGTAIGAMTRQATIERDRALSEKQPLLAEAIRWVGHAAIRSRGTIGGSLAHADPAAELPAVAVCLDAQLGVVGPRGRRTVSADDFFVGYLSTALLSPAATAILRWQAWPCRCHSRTRWLRMPASCSRAWAGSQCALARPRRCSSAAVCTSVRQPRPKRRVRRSIPTPTYTPPRSTAPIWPVS